MEGRGGGGVGAVGRCPDPPLPRGCTDQVMEPADCCATLNTCDKSSPRPPPGLLPCALCRDPDTAPPSRTLRPPRPMNPHAHPQCYSTVPTASTCSAAVVLAIRRPHHTCHPPPKSRQKAKGGRGGAPLLSVANMILADSTVPGLDFSWFHLDLSRESNQVKSKQNQNS